MRQRHYNSAALWRGILPTVTMAALGIHCGSESKPSASSGASGNAPQKVIWPRPVDRPRPIPRRVAPPPRPKKPRLAIGLEVSKAIAKDLILFKKTAYTEQELTPLFERMRKVGDPLCAALWKHKGVKRELAATFIRRRVIWKYRCAVCRRGLVAGCWNFFLMNDRAVDQDFRLVKHLYGKQGPFDCYSVSFIQPYMMHAELGCRSLTLIDIDWRILDGHVQLLRQFRKGAFATAAGMDRALSALNIGWVAYGGKMKPRLPVDRHLLCSKHGQKALCPKYLPAFQRRIAELRRVRLRLAALHDARFDTAREPLTKVVFLSNAIEAGYTNWWEFRTLLHRAKKSLRPGQKMVFIHHIAEFKGRILYELTRTDNGSSLRTVCRDRYTLEGRKRKKFISLQKHAPTSNGGYAKIGTRTREEAFAPFDPLIYFTHFDVRAGSSRHTPKCTTLIRRIDRPHKKQ